MNKNNVFKTIVIFILFNAAIALAMLASENYIKISGNIVNSSNKSIEKAIIIIPEANISIESDKNGFFEIILSKGVICHIEIYKEGYLPYSSEKLNLSGDIKLNITLMEKIKEEVVVTATKTEIPLKDVPIRTELINSNQIQEATGKSVYDIINSYGIGVWVQQSCANCNFTEIRIQGLESGYTQILIDGQPIFSGLANIYGLQQMKNEAIQQIEVVKGSSSSLYGSQAIGGVVNIITKEPTPEPEANFSFTYGSYNSYDLSGLASFRKNIFGFSASAQKSKSDFYDQNNDLFSDKVMSDALNLSFKTNIYLFKDLHKVSLFARYIDELRQGGYLPTINDPYALLSEHISTGRYEYGISYQAILKNKNLLKINTTATYHKRWATSLSRPFNSKEKNKYGEIQYTHSLADDKHRLTTGFSYTKEKINEVINSIPQEEKNATTYGLYVQDEFQANKNTIIVAGIRYDQIKSLYIDTSAINPRLGVRWVANPKVTIRASIGKGFKVPYLFSENLHLCSCAPLIYNPGNLKPEKSLSFNISTEYHHENLSLEANLFRTNIEDKIYFTKKGAPPGYDFIFTNGSGAYTQGIEIQNSANLTSAATFKLGFTFASAQYKELQDYYIGTSKKIMRNPLYSALVSFIYYSERYNAKLESICHITGTMYLENYVVKHIDKTPAFATFDLKIQKMLYKNHLSAALELNNIFNYTQEVRYTPLQEQGAAYIYAPLTGRSIHASIKLNY